MKIGFPIVESGTVLRVQVWLSRPAANTHPCVKCFVHSTAEQEPLLLEASAPFESDLYRRPIDSLLVEGFDVNMRLLGGLPEERRNLIDADRKWLRIVRASGTLCFELLSIARDHTEVDLEFNVSGDCREHRLSPLLNEKSNVDDCKDLVAKITAAVAEQWPLWIMESDLLAVKSQLAVQAQELERWIHPFRARDQSAAWLLAELNAVYRTSLPVPEKKSPPPTGPTTHELFNASLPSPDRDEEQRLTRRKQAYLAKNPARQLLEVQIKALKEHKELFLSRASLRRTQTRHVLIAGPTGCGKTALVKLIALNGIIERGGGVLYIGPIRALVDDFDASFKEEFGELLGTEYGGTEAAPRIVMSSGDISKDDGAISRGDFGLASIVNEKANVLLSAGGKLLERATVVIVDELHMVCDPFRGGVLDLLLTKLLREARRRDDVGQQQPGTLPLQIVGISTEGIAREISSYDSFAFGEDGSRTPVELFVTERPVAVQHRLGVLFDKKASDGRRYELREIVKFENNEQRQLDENSEKFGEQFARTFKKSSHWAELTKEGSADPYDAQFIEMLVERVRVQSTLIAAIPGIKKIESIASALWNRFDRVLDQQGAPDTFEIAVRAAGLTRERRDQLFKWAQRGVFVHHGQYPRVLRREVERIFSVEESPNARHRVLLTTETLSYGVNLSASCVIVYGQEWTRDDVHEPWAKIGENTAHLTQNEYHNLLGRAGRLGRQHAAVNEAIVCVHARELRRDDEKENFLRRYYTEQPIGRPISGALTVLDIKKLDYDKKEKSYHLKTGTKLSDFTYPCFRTVMDSLRSVQGHEGASTEKVLEFLQDSLAFQSLSDKGHRLRFGPMVDHVLRLSAEYQANRNLALVLPRGLEDFLIGLPGSALIDTGTRLESVEPMSRWLDKLVELKLEAPPVELVVVGLLCTPDFLKVGIEITAECRAPEPTELHLQMLMNEVSSALRSELARLVQDEQSLDRILLSIAEIAQHAHAFSKSPQLMPVAILRLTTQVLMWVRGESLERLEEVGNLGHPEGRAIQLQPKHAERLYYLCVMCFRYFDQFDQKFALSHKSQLPRLAVRLKYGLPSKAIPLFSAFSAEGLLPREGVTLLSSRISSAMELLDPTVSTARDECLQLINDDLLNVANVEQATKIVRRFYMQQIHEFCGLIADGYNGEAPFVRRAQEVLIAALTPGHSSRIPECLTHEPKLRSPYRFLFRDGMATFFEDGGDVSFKVSTAAGSDCWALASWFTPLDTDRFLTPCAYVLIVSMLERGFVRLRDVAQKLAEHKGLVSVRTVVEKVIAPNAMESVPVVLREGLLVMFEPALA